MKYNGEFKTIDTEEKAYFLGQAFGDGCNIVKTGEYKFTMASINTDIEIYKKLQSLFPFLKLKTFSSHENMIYLECYEKSFCIDLESLGLISSKTKNDITGKFHFPNIREDLVHHFIRGYFDADGCAWYPTRERSRNNLHIEFGCSTPNFLKEIQKYLENNNIHFTWTERSKKAGNGKYYYSYSLFSSNYNISLAFANFIYKNATLFLNKKHEKCFREKVNMPPKASDIFGNCPYCNSNHIFKQAIRINKNSIKQRLYCVDCNKRFSRPLPSINS